MPVLRILGNEKVQENVGKVASERGPIVYCFKGVDNLERVAHLFLSLKPQLTTEYRGDLLGGIVTVKGRGQIRKQHTGDKEPLKSIGVVVIPSDFPTGQWSKYVENHPPATLLNAKT